MESRRRWERFAPLTGIVFVVLFLLVFFVLSTNTPDTNDSTHKIFSFYSQHRAREEAAAIIFAFAAVFLLLFAACLARRIRLTELLPGGLSWAVLATGTLAAAGFLLFAGTHYATAESANHGLPIMTRTLSNLDGEVFPAFFISGVAFYLVAGIAVAKSRALPRWVGFLGIAVAVLSINPIGFFAWFFGGIIFVLIASAILMREPATPAAAGSPPGPTPA